MSLKPDSKKLWKLPSVPSRAIATQKVSSCSSVSLTVALSIETPDEAERIFAGLADGGQVMHALRETFFAHRFGMLVDRFGIPWIVNCEKAEQRS